MQNQKFDYHAMPRTTVQGRRCYQTPDGRKLPSVTTILDATRSEQSKAALAAWRQRVGSQQAQQITTEAANRGTRMHQWIEDYIRTGHTGSPGSHPESQRSHRMASVIIARGLCDVAEVWGNEVSLYYPELYAGTTDCVGVYRAQQCIIDFKQSNKPKRREWIDDYFLQLTAYALAHNQVYGTQIKQGVIMLAVRPDADQEPEYQQFELADNEFDLWEQRWWDRVEQYYRLNT